MGTQPTANERITALILDHLNEGRIPWTQPWVVHSSGVISHATGKPYSLRNRMLLKYGGEYATFNQVRAAGGSVVKGSKSHTVFFGQYIDKKNDADEVVEQYYLLRAYCVFRVGTQTSGIEPKYRDKWECGGIPSDDSEVCKTVYDYCQREGVTAIGGGAEAFYCKNDDTVQIPGVDTFENRSQYWYTVFHELVHSTGHPARLKRIKHDCWGDSKYAQEELVADIGACLCLGRLNLDTTECIRNSTGYIQSWKQHIKDFKPSDFSEAVRQAEMACNFIFGVDNAEKKES